MTALPSQIVSAPNEHTTVVSTLREACHGLWSRTPKEYAALARVGWTDSEIDRLQALAIWACEHHTALAHIVNTTGNQWDHGNRVEDLVDRRRVHGGPDLREARVVLSWLVRIAAEPRITTLVNLMTWLSQDPSTRLSRHAWIQLGEAGALAHAAGLTLKEAQHHLAYPGREALQALQILAGLRGFTFPPDTFFATDLIPTWLVTTS